MPRPSVKQNAGWIAGLLALANRRWGCYAGVTRSPSRRSLLCRESVLMPRRRSIATSQTNTPHLAEITSRKVEGAVVPFAGGVPEPIETVSGWTTRYLKLAVVGVRSEEVADKIEPRPPPASGSGWS